MSTRTHTKPEIEQTARLSASTNAQCRQAVEQALEFAKNKAVPLKGLSIKDMRHEGHRV